MNGLSDVADSLYSQAYNEYATKKSDLSGKISALQQQDQLAQNAHSIRQQNYWNQMNNAESEYANAVSSKQQKEAENTQYWGNLMELGGRLLPYLLGAMGLI